MGQSGGSQRISIEAIEAAGDALDKLEPKPKQKQTQDEKLFNLRDKIERVLQLGYSYEEISFVLSRADIDVSSQMLESCFGRE